MQKNIWLRLTNEQISPGTWYFGLFNGIGPMRTRSKMINRGSAYSFSGNVSVEGCMTSLMLGPFCNQTVNMLSCNANNNLTGAGMDNECRCDRITEALFIAAANITFNQTQPSNITRSRVLMCYARHGSTPLEKTYDFSGDLSKAPLVINFPKAGRWFITIRPIDISNKSEEVQSNSSKVCYLLDWQVFQCPFDKAGLNCTMEKYMLQTVLRKSPSHPFESNYIPITEKVSLASDDFPLEPLLSNFSSRETSDDAWTFFLLNIPSGATGGNIHIRLTSSVKINYEIYARNGLPSLSTWDYFYASSTNSSSGSMFFKLYDSSEKAVSFYMFYAKGGLWSFGLRKLDAAIPSSQTVMSISLGEMSTKMLFPWNMPISFRY
ncbi:UNVERIFIED_CONTAM: hypothetical protein Sangu_0013700 [Sesamum angustifolium]|uniref:Uncharacterized protein n=1 Tax=Sesamum angustifolium TaxID=2727405 RepID=A0AAW2RHE2_9LAMI